MLIQLQMKRVECVCGYPYCITDILYQKMQEDGRSIWCPKCGVQWHFTQWKQQEIDRLKLQLQSKDNALDYYKNSRRALEGHNTRLKNKLTRVNAGTCPHCNRTFKQLAAHMKNKHPECRKQKGR